MKDFELMLEEAQTDEAKQDVLMCEACDINVERAVLAFDTFNRMQNLRKRTQAVRLASVTATGDFDKMVAYYEDEGSTDGADKEKKESLIRRVWETIKKWWNNLWSSFKKTAEKAAVENTADEEECEIEQEVVQAAEESPTLIAKMKACASNVKPDTIKAVITSAKVVVGAVAAIAAGKAVVKSCKSGKLKSLWDKAKGATERGEEVLNTFENNTNNFVAMGYDEGDLDQFGEDGDSKIGLIAKLGLDAAGKAFMKELGFEEGSNASAIQIMSAIVRKALAGLREICGKILNAILHPIKTAKAAGSAIKNKISGKKGGAAEASANDEGETQEESVIEESFEDELDKILAGVI